MQMQLQRPVARLHPRVMLQRLPHRCLTSPPAATALAPPAPHEPPAACWLSHHQRGPTPLSALKTAKRSGNGNSAANGRRPAPLFLQVEPDGSDAWRLDRVAEMLRSGGVGIIPTDSNPAFVCDLEDRGALQRLVEMKGIAASKSLSILVRDWAQVSKYTQGFPTATAPGQPDAFKLARRLLPGPYTLILAASKQMPKQVTNFVTGRSKSRSTVGVRMPDDPLCQALLQQLDRPLLCSSAKVEGGDDDGGDGPVEAAHLLDVFGPRGLDFVVDAGPRAPEDSTVVDMTGAAPELVRQGKGEWREEW